MPPTSFLARKTLGQPHYFLIAMAAAFLVALVPRGARKAVESNTNKAEDWLPSSYAEAKDLKWFRNHFVGEQFALVSWDGCTLGDADKLQFLARKLAPAAEAHEFAGASDALREDYALRRAWYARVVTGPGVLEQLTSPPVSLSYGEALQRLEGALVGPVQRDAQGKPLGNDSRVTCLIVYLSPEATRDNRTMRAAIEKVAQIAATECGIPASRLRMGGPPVDNVTIDVEGERTLVRLASLAGIVGAGLCYWCFRSLRLTGVVFAIGVISAGMSLAIVFYFGAFEVFGLGRDAPRFGTVDAILMSMPAVVYVLGLSGAIHTVNYYRDVRRERGIFGAAEAAVRDGWWPCTLAAFTTALGLGSLATSDILPIKKFGLFTGVAVVATVGVLFALLPVFLHRFPVSDDLIRRQSANRSREALPWWARRLFQGVLDHHRLVFAFWMFVMLAVGAGMARIGTSVQLLKLLDPQADLIHDYAWLEKNLGNLVPMEVVLAIPPEKCRTADEQAESSGDFYRMTMLERLELLREIERRMEQLPEISRVMSVATFTPKVTDSGIGAADTSGDYAKNKSLEEHRQELLRGEYLRKEKSPPGGQAASARELWRLSARVAALSADDAGVDYGQFASEIEACVKPVLRAYEQRDEVIRQLHAAGKQLQGGRFVLLYRSPARDETLQPEDPEHLLLHLLRQSGPDLRRQGMIPYNLARFDDPQQGSAAADQAYRQAALDSFRQYDALVVASPAEETAARRLAADGLHVIDASRILFGHETPPGAASDPLTLQAEFQPVRAVYTGMVPLVYKTQRQLLVSLRESIAWATVLIAFVMMLVLRNPYAGLVSMIPNVFPIFVTFGALGWLNVKVDIGIMMTASVALGVAVDDTIHYLTWFRRGIAQGLSRRAAAMAAYERCSVAMFQTTLIGGLGLAVFATSTFTPTQQFGYLMIAMLAVALVGDLLLLPAILVGPLGNFFGPAGDAAAWPAPAEPASATVAASVADAPQGAAASEAERSPRPWPAPIPAGAEPRIVPRPAAATAVPLRRRAEPARQIEPSAGISGILAEDRHALSEGPHAELHAKLRRLRRDAARDSRS